MNRPDATPRSFTADTLNAALSEVGGSARPGYLDDIVTRAARTRQRPSWTFIERWLPMSTFSSAPPLAPVRPLPTVSMARVLTLLVLALLTAALIGSALLGTSPSPLPESGVRNGLIAFDAARDIWVVNPDGTGLRRLTETPEFETSPVWSPDDTELAVWRIGGGERNIVLMDDDGSIRDTIVPPEGIDFADSNSTCNAMALWSPDGRTLAASALTPEGANAVAVLDAATGAGYLLGSGMPVCQFAWSPVGSMLAVTGGDEKVYLSDPEGDEIRRLSPDDRIAWTGALGDATPFSPDGEWIAMEQRREGEQAGSIFIVGLDGQQRHLADGRAPSVSPDGRWVAFVVGVGQGRHDQFVVPADGSAEPRLVHDDVCACMAAWSPDGKLLATLTPGWFELLILDAFGDAAPVRVPSPANVGVLSWQALR